MSVTADAIDKIELLVKKGDGKLVDIDGKEYATQPLFDPEAAIAKAPQPDTLVLHTLEGFAAYVSAGLDTDGEDIGTLATVHVVSHLEARLIGGIEGHHRQRAVYAKVEFETLFGGAFGFGRFMDAESFNVGLQSLFVDTPERARVLGIVGNMQAEGVRGVSDDGVSQQVTARAGIVRKSEAIVPNPVTLEPFRTFREIDQPESPFILRLKGDPESMPQCALFEADGGAWKLDAIRLIAEWLREKLPKDAKVIA